MADISGKDLAYRAVAAVLGGPVDLTTMVMRPFGYKVEQPVLGSEWIGSKLEQGGIISSARDPLKEFIASLLVPGGGIEIAAAKGPALMAGLGGVIKAKGGNWLTGSVENAVNPLKSAYDPAQLPVEQRTSPAAVNQSALNTWIDKQLTKYIKTELATSGDPVRALAEKGTLHTKMPNVGEGIPDKLKAARKSAGFSETGVAQSDLAKKWEVMADQAVSPRTAGEQMRAEFPNNSETMPWLEKLGPNTPVYYASNNHLGGLDFRHLTDELKNSLNPDSGLPRNLQLNPVSLNRMGVPQAVEHVAKINKWREEQTVASNLKIANNPATHLVKEYPTVPYSSGQANTRGLKWVEVKAPGEIDSYTTSHGLIFDKENKNYKAVEEALKYEGDIMGHCVGGYCEDVLSGNSKIYSLRDAKGKPHVTIEVKKPASAEQYDSLMQRADEGDQDALEELSNLGPMDFEATGNYISQIKGKGNAAPKDEYVPFVQDFLRSQGQWSDIGDIENAKMFMLPDNHLATEQELNAALDAMTASPELRKNLTPKWLANEINNPIPGRGNPWWPKVKSYLDELQKGAK